MKEATTIREAIRQWEDESGRRAHEATEVKLIGLYPPIEKTDQTLQTLVLCEKLSLSTNAIEKVGHLSSLTNLKILSLSRNNVKSFAGLEALGDTLEQLWISYNQIEKMKGINIFKKLKVLYMSNNLVKEWSEFVKLVEVPSLEELNFVGNPLEEKHTAEGTWRPEVEKRLAFLKKLDGLPIIRDVDEAAFLHQQKKQDPQETEEEGEAAEEEVLEQVDEQKIKSVEDDDDDEEEEEDYEQENL